MIPENPKKLMANEAQWETRTQSSRSDKQNYETALRHEFAWNSRHQLQHQCPRPRPSKMKRRSVRNRFSGKARVEPKLEPRSCKRAVGWSVDFAENKILAMTKCQNLTAAQGIHLSVQSLLPRVTSKLFLIADLIRHYLNQNRWNSHRRQHVTEKSNLKIYM